ncbi:MAG: hypothetical protein A3H32_16285 [Betaproteobacteria bacterium RIFCSPLOWO2_02_FULL_63_19]|nr:MAG: hypothetical protein A3H32_16285 [Betaproteobacteria bacterium RIFCSPLOWO2_02_FULL_63_19]
MKYLKIAGVVIVATVLLAAGAVAYVASQFDAERITAEVARVVKATTHRTLRIDGGLRLGFWPDVALGVGRASLSERGSEQPFASLDSARLSIAVMPLLSRKLVVTDVEVRGIKANLIRRKDGTLNIADLVPVGGTPRDRSKVNIGRPSDGEALQLDIAGVHIDGAALTWRDERSGGAVTLSGLQLDTGRLRADTSTKTYSVESLTLAMKGRTGADTFEFTVEAPKLVLLPEKSGAGSMSLSATLTGQRRNVAARLALSGVEGIADVLKIARLTLDVDAKAGEASVKGRLESALVAELGKHDVKLERISGGFDIEHPRIPTRQLKVPFSGTLRADLAKESVQGRISSQFDESKLALAFGVTRFAAPALSFKLDVDRFNLDRYLPPKGAEQNAGERGKTRSEAKLDFSPLRALNLNGAVEVDRLQAANVKAANLRLRIRAAGGRLDIAPITAGLYQGTANGSLALDANGNSVELKQDVVNVRIGPLLRDIANKDIIEGSGNVLVDVRAHGETADALKRSLAGSASVALRNGAVKGINLAQSFRDLKAKFSRRQDAVQKAKATDKTDFSELTATFKIAGGVARNRDLSAKSPFLRLSGSGDIDIGASRLDYLAKASVVASAGGQGAKDLDHLRGITVPVRLTGSFDDPSWTIELAGLASEALKARVEEKSKDIRRKAQDQIRNRLKGLFAR